MIVETLQERTEPLQTIDKQTGYVPERLTWSFRAMLYMANLGLRIQWIEDFDRTLFLRDARAAIAPMFDNDDDLIARILEGTDVRLEQDVVANLLNHPRVQNEIRVPTVSDIKSAIKGQSLALCPINVRVLQQREGWYGHFVVVDGYSSTEVRTQDPGLPPVANQWLDDERFAKAWAWPEPALASATLISR
ncbi:hypothetical protein [Miltoncostaea oceani]|uniref:hypothetical protein n=1 Tax=Miltoncostaea oceani TaxID=2843216 RepID=UPI001C3E67EE|nr:hypothetical protein [Miltoncostaea oceani]